MTACALCRALKISEFPGSVSDNVSGPFYQYRQKKKLLFHFLTNGAALQ
jgi:hypothetical protein